MRWFVALVTAACLWAAGGTPRDGLELRDRQAAHIAHAPGGAPTAFARKAPPHSRVRFEDPFVLVAARLVAAPDRAVTFEELPVRGGLVTLSAPSPISRGPPRA